MNPTSSQTLYGGVRSNGLPEWKSLRVLIAPAYSNKLIVSLVVLPRTGHPTLHPTLRQLEQEWFPQMHTDDLTAHAVGCAFLRLSQTQR
jgi:hypothetical protein